MLFFPALKVTWLGHGAWYTGDSLTALHICIVNQGLQSCVLHISRVVLHKLSLCDIFKNTIPRTRFEFKAGKITVPNMNYAHLNNNSLIPRRCDCNLKSESFHLISRIVILSVSSVWNCPWVKDLTDGQKTSLMVNIGSSNGLVPLLTTIHYLNQRWPRYLSP